MTRTLRLAVAGFLAATACATPATAVESGAADRASTTRAEGAVSAKQAARFMDRYLRHGNRDEWRWVRQHSNRRMKEAVRVLRIDGDHGTYRRSGRCWGYDESDLRTCSYLLSGEPMGEIGVRRRADGSLWATQHARYS